MTHQMTDKSIYQKKKKRSLFSDIKKYFKTKWLPKVAQMLVEDSRGEVMKVGKDITILVVDDDAGPREAFRMILKDRYTVLTAEDAQEALNKITQTNIDIVALDIKMPGMDGLQLLHKIKSSQPEIEVLLITGYPSVQTAIEAMHHGAYDYIIKPFDKERILEVVNKGVIRRRQAQLGKSMMSSLIEEICNEEEKK